ncbi:common plant regulatory factor 1 isoform X2 [Lactuca sativa]|uniref:common plant regulatory factor 1 isoform X2 n=1 Tax=Lactuca sativa TaxID=4236 RepID=UPI000CD8A1E3|nr:common plant regulatory factor 1 isoform X2 [Lactuca sativa]
MGISEEAQDCKPEKSSSPPPQQQTSVHVYPDWAAMQAYYGPRMAVPPYYNPAVASGHAPPPYMWGPPQHMMPPYAAFYPHGGVYAHPAVHLANSPLNIDSPAKSSGGSDRGLMKKLKGFDGLAMSIGNPSNGEGGNNDGNSHSGETEGTSEGSDGNTTERGKNGGKRSSEGSLILSEVEKAEPQRADGASSKMMTGVGILSPNPVSALNLKNFPNTAADITSPIVTLMPNEALFQNDRELKREKRKQSNRESARRSRLRKQAEAEELAVKVEALNSENLSLRSEINRLTDNSEKLKLQNAELMEKLKEVSSLSTANLISRVDNSSGELYETNKNTNTNTRQLLDSSPRAADAVAAG